MTFEELYEKVKPEIEAAKKPFKEYKNSRKTFSEIFEESNPSEKLTESKTYSALYEQYAKEQLEPLSEQEQIYLVAKLESGERLSESELQKLSELNPVGWSLGRTLGNAIGLKTAGQQAYNQARAAGKNIQQQQKVAAKQLKTNNLINNKYGQQLGTAYQNAQNTIAANNDSKSQWDKPVAQAMQGGQINPNQNYAQDLAKAKEEFGKAGNDVQAKQKFINELKNEIQNESKQGLDTSEKSKLLSSWQKELKELQNNQKTVQKTNKKSGLDVKAPPPKTASTADNAGSNI
jgi:hypothetical protein